MMRSIHGSLLLCGVIVGGVALVPAEAPLVPALIVEYEADDRSVSAAFDLEWSERQRDRHAKLDEAWIHKLEAVPFESLSRGDQADWLLLRNDIEKKKAMLRREAQQLAQMEFLLPFRSGIQRLESQRQERLPMDAEQAAAGLADMIRILGELRSRIDEKRKKAPDAAVPPAAEPAPLSALPDITPSLAWQAAKATDAIRASLRDWFQFYDGYQPDFGWWVREPSAKLIGALEAHSKFLREEIAGLKGEPGDPLVGYPIGSAELASGIAGEMLPYPAEELIAIGEREFAWCEQRMQETAAAMGTDRVGVLEKIKAAHVPPGAQDELVAVEAERAVAFLKKHELVTIPELCEETWRMRMIPADLQKTLPYAVYSQPAMMVAYACESMPYEDKLMSMRGNNRHFARIVTPHELIPGHHLQRYMSDRCNPWRRRFNTPFYVEGWALHWEMLLWDLGYAESPEDRAGMLFWRMHRCARVIVSLKFHIGKMTPAEMVDFLVQRVGHEKMGAASEVRRYIGGDYGPLYQASYLLGGLQFRALHRELTGPGKLSNRAFHDAVLKEGSMPVELLRAVLTNAPLSRNWRSTWRFAEP